MNRQDLFGHVPPINDEQLADVARPGSTPYPLGIPRRLTDATAGPIAPSPTPHEITHLTASDVPGVLIAAGLSEILASLTRIHRAKGFEASDRAYHAILARTLADGRDDLARQLTEVRQKLAQVRAKADPTDVGNLVHGLMQQRAGKPLGKVFSKVAELQAEALAEQREHDERNKLHEIPF